VSHRKWSQAIAEFLVENLTTLLTIGFAAFIIYRQHFTQLALSTDNLLIAILGVLGLLAVSGIIERYRRFNSIEKAVYRSLAFLESRFTERPSAIAFFERLPSLDSYVQGANQIDLCGITKPPAGCPPACWGEESGRAEGAPLSCNERRHAVK